MEWLRNQIKQTTTNEYIEEEIPTPCSKTEKMAMLIHRIEWHTDDPKSAEGDYAALLVGLYSHSQESAVGLADPDCIDSYQQSIMVGRYEGTLSEYFEYYKDPQVKVFDPPILYAKSTIFHGLSTVQYPGASLGACSVRIGYTLEKVAAQDFIDALVEG